MQFFFVSINNTHFPLLSSGYKEQTTFYAIHQPQASGKKNRETPLKKITGLIINFD